MGNLKFGEQSTKELGLVIQAPPVYEFPSKEVTVTHIPGRNGDLVIDTDSFKNVTRTYSIASVFKPGTDFVANSEKIIKWLTSKAGYQRLEDSYDPEVYRLAVFKNNGALQNYYDEATAINITFECKPQRYLKVGEQEVSVESSEMTIKNPTLMTSLPIIKLDGIDTSVNDKVIMCSIEDKNQNVTANITISNLDSGTVIFDSEKQLVEDSEGNNIAKSVNLNGAGFPKFKADVNKIKVEKYSEVPLSVEAYQNLIDRDKKALIARYKPYEDLLQSKQNKASIKSWKRLIEDTQEQYDAEAYQNLALDNAYYHMFESFNIKLSEFSSVIEFNTDQVAKDFLYFNDYDDLNTYEWSITQRIFQGILRIVTKGDFEYGYQGMHVDTYSAYKYCYLLKNDFTKCVDDGTHYGCFVKIEDLNDTSRSSSYIYYCSAYSDEEIFTDNLKQKIINGSDDNERSLSKFLYGDNNTLIKGSNYRITLYRANWNNGNPTIYYDNEDEPNWFRTAIVYGSDSNKSGSRCALQVTYSILYDGYVYKKSGSSGILSNIISNIGSIFNRTGWTHITANSVVESVSWDTNKRNFVFNSFPSSSEDYTIERYFILEGDLPQYQDIVVKDVYETDAAGKVILDAAGNKVNKIIKNRLDIVSVSDKLSEITQLRVKYTGYYRFNDNDRWYLYNEGDLIDGPSASNRGYNTKTTKSNKIYYLAEVPSYSTTKDYPEWLEVDPILYNNNNQQVYNVDALNADKYDFVVKKKGWYWYNFIESEVSKITIYEIRDTNSVIGNIMPDTSTHRNVDDDFTVYELDIDSDNPDIFPIHEYEFVETTDSSGKIYLPNIKGNVLLVFDMNKVYHRDDYCLKDDNTDVIYKCIVDNTTSGAAFDPDQWEAQVDLVQLSADNYDSTKEYLMNDYCIYDRSLWKCIATIQSPEEFDNNHWIKCGEYIKNIGFFDLSQGGSEEEYKLNIPPDWLKVHIVRGSSADYSDTALEYKVLDPATDTNYYLWNENTAWIKWDKKEDPTETDVITTELYKKDSSIFMLEELPVYDSNDYYTVEIVESSSGNPESVNIKVKENSNGYFKVGNSSNYKYYNSLDLLDNVKIDQKLDMTYLDPDDGSMSGVVISVIPKWWSL